MITQSSHRSTIISFLLMALVVSISGCGPPPTPSPENFVVVPANDSTPPTVGMIVEDNSALHIDVNETSQPTAEKTRSDNMSVSVGAIDKDGGVKAVRLWATYTYLKPDQIENPGLAAAPIQQDVSNANVGEPTLKNRFFVYDFNLRKKLGCWSSLQVDVWAEGENFSGAKVKTPVVSITYVPRSIPVLEGHLYRESSSQDMYVIHSGKKIRIPNSNALAVMGYSASNVEVVEDGALSCYIRFDIPSLSNTPGSLIFPPDGVKHFPLKGVVPNGTIMFSQEHEIQLVELYGWIIGVADDTCQPYGDGGDFHYGFELDTEWAIAQGIDLNGILRVGNIAMPEAGLMLLGFSPRRAVSLPLLKIELDSWGRGPENDYPPSGPNPPADWPASTPPVAWPNKGICNLVWPFDPLLRNLGGSTLTKADWSLANPGTYVRIAGSLVTDSPHDFFPCEVKGDVLETEIDVKTARLECPPGASLSGNFAITQDQTLEWQGSARDWSPGLDTGNSAHYARWTEIHPPDLIEVIDKNDPRYKRRTVTTRGIALQARVGKLVGGLSNSCEEVEVDIFPPEAKPLYSQITYQLAYEELRGPETHFPWGENADNGSWISVFDNHIRVKARVCGGDIFGSPGRFKAIYRVWWRAQPVGQVLRTGSFETWDHDKIEYVIEPNVVASDMVEFGLCLGHGLTWEKRINMPDDLSNSKDLIVKDSKQCDTESLLANQVSHGQVLGQVLIFSKEKGLFAGITNVYYLPLSDLGNLPGGARVTFTWVKDN